MHLRELLELRDRAAAPVLDQIAADKARCSFRIAPLLDCIREHVFEPGFSFKRLRELCMTSPYPVVTR